MHWIAQLVFQILIHWIVIYPLDSAIHLFNNLGQDAKEKKGKKRNRMKRENNN